jgi:hypothetical protein
MKDIGKNGVKAYVWYDPTQGKPKLRGAKFISQIIKREHQRHKIRGLTFDVDPTTKTKKREDITDDDNREYSNRDRSDGAARSQETTARRIKNAKRSTIHKGKSKTKGISGKRSRRVASKKTS